MRRLAAVLLLLAAPAGAADWGASRPAPKPGRPYPDCYCTNRGVRVELGATACLRVDGRTFTARCAMSQNSPTWRREREGCAPGPVSSAPPASGPHGRG